MNSTPQAIDPILLEVIKNRLISLTEEMGATLMRTAFSPNIKERRDLSCALFNADAEMIAQAAHIPVHLGSMPLSVQAAIERCEFHPGDMVMLNDPYCGGTHLPDLTLVQPVFVDDDAKPRYFLANRAHHADIGGMQPGSLPLSSEIFQEGLRIPPVKICRGGELDEDLLALFLSNVRTPIERKGDLMAQIAANRVGEKRLREALQRFSNETVEHYCNALLDYAAQWTRNVIADIPDGRYHFVDYLDDDGLGEQPVELDCLLKIEGEQASVDFRNSADQVPGCMNAVRAITLSAVSYVFRLLTPQDAPYNSGSMRPLSVLTRPGSLLDCSFPAAVAAGNVETSQRIVDLLLGALAQALPEKIPAASGGSMNNLLIGGAVPGQDSLFAYYETIGNGAGGGPQGAGADGIQTHMTNTLNTPAEALEHAYPLLVREYALRRDATGGQGQHPGGRGIVREIELLGPAQVTLISERRRRAPYALAGGSEGARGKNLIYRDGQACDFGGKASVACQRGDRIRVETPGGGGWGDKSTSKNEEDN